MDRLDAESAAWVRSFLPKFRNDPEKLAKWLRYSLQLGSLIDCRNMVNEAINYPMEIQ